MTKLSNARPPIPFRDGLWRHVLFSKKISGRLITMLHGAVDFRKSIQPIMEEGPRAPGFRATRAIWARGRVCLDYGLYTFAKIHPLTMDSKKNTRDIFKIFLDPRVSIMMLPGALGFC